MNEHILGLDNEYKEIHRDFSKRNDQNYHDFQKLKGVGQRHVASG